MKTLKSIVILLIVSLTATAQRSEYESRYRAALDLYKRGMYGKAQVDFFPLTAKKYDYPQTPYAHYYYGLVATRNNQLADAKNMLKQLVERYPNWDKMDEAYYVMANAQLASDDFDGAMETSRKISSDALNADLFAMQDFYTSKIQKIETLKNLYAKYPESKVIALNMADLIMRTSTDKKDLELADVITNRYGVKGQKAVAVAEGSEDVTPQTRNASANKGYINVGVLFPFGMPDLDPDKRTRANQYALDMYEGIKLAKSALQREGVIINLYAYDIDNRTEPMRELLQNKQFSQVDMVFGPLHAETNRIASNYCNQNKIPLINPLATNKELLTDQPYSFLGQASTEMKAAKAAMFAQNHFSDHTCAVFFSGTKQDSLLASMYVGYMQQAGYEVLTFAKLPSGTSDQMAVVLPDGKAKRIGHVFLSATAKGLGSSFLAALERRKINCPVFTSSEVFNLQSASGSMFSGREVYLLNTNHNNMTKEEIQKFQQSYLSKYNTLPSEYGMYGYDMMLFFGRMMGKSIPNFKKNIAAKSYTEGYFTGGYDYTESNENQIVQVLQFDNFKIVPVR